MRVFWQLDFENRWHGMALLSDSVRTVRFASEVFRFTTDLDSDKKCKLDLLQRLKQYQDADHEAPRAVCLRVLPYDPDDVTNVEMIKAIVATRNQEMLDTQFVSAVLDDAWNSIWPWYYWHTGIALLQVVCICLSTWNLSYGGRPHYLFAAFLLFGVVKRGIEEVWQAVLLVTLGPGFVAIPRFFREPRNTIDTQAGQARDQPFFCDLFSDCVLSCHTLTQS